MAGSFSDYIVYVDESGDHGLAAINPSYPVFVLAFCIFEKTSYVAEAVPELQRLKFKYFGHDMVVLHERDIRKGQGDFAILADREVRHRFMDDMSRLIGGLGVTLIAVGIEKNRLATRYARARNPYHLALEFGLERVSRFLAVRGSEKATTHVVFEKRGTREDAELELEFRRVCGGGNYRREAFRLEPRFAHKGVNSSGLQLADLFARPIGLRMMRPTQVNRAFEILETKFDGYPNYLGLGLKLFPGR